MKYIKSKDIFIQRRNQNNNGFDEYSLAVLPDAILMTDINSNPLFAPKSAMVVSASYALSASYAPPSDYAISASWASASISASYANSASWAPTPIIPSTDSASWASSSISSSYTISASYAPLILSNYAISASWASASISASYVPNLYPQTIQISASWASQSLSASWAPMPSVSNSSSWASSSISSSYALTASNFANISGSNILYLQCDDNNTYEVTLTNYSGSIIFSIGQTPVTNTNNFLNIGTISIPGLSGSWASSSISASYANTASYALNGGTGGTSTISSSWASSSISASYAISASYSNQSLSSSWAKQSDTASLCLTSVGMITVPTITTSSISPSGSAVTIGSAFVHFCTDPLGNGPVAMYSVPEASFVITSSFINSQFIVATYNSGSPIYQLIEDKITADGIQSTLVYTVLNGTSGDFVYSSWDTPGLLLANKDLLRVQSLRGVERETGLELSTSGSTDINYITIASGYAWQGINRQFLSAVNSAASRFVLVAHSASVWSGSFIDRAIYNRYDDGTNLVSLPSLDYVCNYVYRVNVNTNATLVLLSPNYNTLADAIASIPPVPPLEMKDYAVLTGRIICRNSITPTNRLQQIDSAYVQTFVPAGITNHNDLLGLQGGDSTLSQYYHLTSAEYTNLQAGSASWSSASISASYAPATPSDYAISASWASASFSATTASYATLAGDLSGSVWLNTSESFTFVTTSIYSQSGVEGRVFWDSQDNTLAICNSPNVTQQVGQEVMIRFQAGENVANGVALYATTNSFYNPDKNTHRLVCNLAIADGTGLRSTICGVATETVSSGSRGFMTMIGDIHGLNTNAYTEGSPIYLSTTTSGSFTSTRPTPPYEQVYAGICTFKDATNGTITVNIANPPVTSFVSNAGMTILPTISGSATGSGLNLYVTGNGTVNLYNNTSGSDTIKNYFLAAYTGSMPNTGSTYYLVASYNTGVPSYNLLTSTDTINNTTITPVATIIRPIYKPTAIEYIFHDQFGYALSNKLNQRLIRTERYAHETGLVLAESSSRVPTISAGAVWFGGSRITTNAVNGALNSYRLFRTWPASSTGWSSSVVTQYNNNEYDNGAGSLVALSGAGTQYAVNFMFKSLAEGDNDLYSVLGRGNYSLAQAQASTVPSPLPAMLSPSAGLAVLVGRIIVAQGATTAYSIESAWETTFQASAGTDHNALSNLQGGTAGEYYHLTAAQSSSINISASYALSASYAPATPSDYAISASWASSSISASYAPSSGGTSLSTGSTYPITSSWAVSASYALNGGSTGTTAYTTVTTSSTNWITCSFSDTREYINITDSALYNFTCSNVPANDQIAEVSLFINNTAIGTSSLSFPANWIFLGSKPNAITASKSGILSLQSYGPSIQVAGFSVQY